MKLLYCAQAEKDGLSLQTISGARVTEPLRSGSILLSRLDCDVRVLSVPPVAAREIRSFIRYRLRALYPGSPDDTFFDFRLAGAGERRRAIVYLMRRETMERYRPHAKRGRLIAADQLLNGVLGKDRNGAVLFVREAYVEYLNYANGELAESSVLRLNGRFDLPAACRRGRDAGGQPPSLAPVWITERQDDRRIRSAREGNGRAGLPAIRSLEEALAAIRMPPWRRSRMALFRTRRPRAPKAPFVALLLATLVLALAGLHVRSIVGGYERRYEQVRSEYLRRQASFKGDDRTSRMLDELRARYRSLAGRRPIDTYALLHTLAHAAARTSGEGRATIDSVTLNGTTLAVQGSATEPFRLTEALSSCNGFSRVRIIEAIPAGEGRPVRFTMTGAYDDR